MKNFNNIPFVAKAHQTLTKLRPYSFVIFVALVGIVYATVLLRVQSLSNQQPTDEAISSQVEAARIPHIDPKVVEQLNSLEDNSVSIKTLFDEARSNPFDQ